MLLGGLWHGAAWRFVVWGGIHGLALAFEKMINLPAWVGKNKFTRVFGVLLTFHIVCLCWIFFRAESFAIGMEMINQILFFFHGEVFIQFIVGYPAVFAFLVVGFILHFVPRSAELKTEALVGKLPTIGKAILLIMVIWLVIQVKSSDIQPFIYFQF